MASKERQDGRLYEFGPFRLDTSERVLLCDEEPVALTPKLYDTLLALVERSGRIVEKGELMEAVWPDAFVEESNLTSNVSLLRKALGEAENGKPYIETVPRRGYRFSAQVRRTEMEPDEILISRRTTTHIVRREAEEFFDADEDEANRANRANGPGDTHAIEAASDRTGTHARSIVTQSHAQAVAPDTADLKDAPLLAAGKAETERRRLGPHKAAYFAVAAVVLLSVAALYFLFKDNLRTDATGDEVKTLAVLPFRLLNAQAEDEYLGLGISDALITKFGNTRRIIVRPTSAVMKFTDGGSGAIEAGRELGVDAVLEGSVQRAGERLRLTVRLLRTSDGVSLWGETFESPLRDVFAVQDAVSEQVARSLVRRLSPQEDERMKRRYTDNTEAYQAYLRGRYFWNKQTGEGRAKAVEHFRRAIEIDPSYALAYAGLADCYHIYPPHGAVSREDYPKAKDAALKALEIDDTLAEAHSSLGVILHSFEWKFREAESRFLRAIELNPNHAPAHLWYAQHLSHMGRHDEAIAEARRALELDPLSLLINTELGYILSLARRDDEAIAQLRKTLEMEPNYVRAYYTLMIVTLGAKRFEESIEWQRKAFAMQDIPREIIERNTEEVKRNYRSEGERGFWRTTLKLSRDPASGIRLSPRVTALHYANLDKDKAFEWLERAYAERDPGLTALKVYPQSDLLRSDPRFRDLLQRIGFPDE